MPWRICIDHIREYNALKTVVKEIINQQAICTKIEFGLEKFSGGRHIFVDSSCIYSFGWITAVDPLFCTELYGSNPPSGTWHNPGLLCG